MDPSIINQWNCIFLRKTVCAVCKGLIRKPCPKCKGQNTNEPCWAQLDNNLGYRHRHCSGRQMETQN